MNTLDKVLRMFGFEPVFSTITIIGVSLFELIKN